MQGERLDEEDGDFYQIINRAIKSSGKSFSQEELADLIGEVIEKASSQVAPSIIETLYETSPRMLRQEKRARIRFERRLRKYWGKGARSVHDDSCCL